VTNKELVLSIYPKARLAITTFGASGYHAKLNQLYYIRNGDSVISNQLIPGPPKRVWKYAADKIKNSMLERFEK